MRLLVVTQTFDENDPVLGFFVAWVTAMAKECTEVHVLALTIRSVPIPKNVFVHSLGKDEGASRIVWLWRLWKRSMQLRQRYDAVFVHMTPIHMCVGGLLWRLLGKRTGLWYTHSAVDLKLRIATLFSHHVFTASTESFLLNSRKKLVTGHGIDATLFPFKAHIHTEQPRLIVVGRISPIKHIERAILALAALRPRIDARLTIIGRPGSESDTRYEESLKELVQKHTVEQYVTWMGAVAPSRIGAMLTEHDVFVHTSQTHSTDKVLLEAMLSGLLVVTANTAFRGVVPEQCFSTLDSGDIASKVQKLLALPIAEQNALREGLRTRIEHEHNLTTLIQRIVAVYSRDLGHDTEVIPSTYTQ